LCRKSAGKTRRIGLGKILQAHNGDRQCLNLGVKVRGTPPASLSLKDLGDMNFERSREAARVKLEGVIEEARTKQGSVRLVEKLYEIKVGEKIKTVLLDDLHPEWGKIPRKKKLDDRYSSQCQSTLKRFAEFVRCENRGQPRSVVRRHAQAPLPWLLVFSDI
jgi:hypothetical protein